MSKVEVNNKEVMIKKLVIKIGKNEVTVTPEEAEELHKALGKMFGEKIIEHHHHDWWLRRWEPIYTPPTYYGTNQPLPSSPVVYCSNNQDGSNLLTIEAGT